MGAQFKRIFRPIYMQLSGMNDKWYLTDFKFIDVIDKLRKMR